MSKKPNPLSSFSECQTLDVCIWKVLTLACEQLGVQTGTFFKVDLLNGVLEVINSTGLLPWRLANSRFPINRGVCGWVAEHIEATIVNDVTTDPRFNNKIDLVTQFKTHSILCVPVVVNGRPYGVLELMNRQDKPFNPSDLEVLETLLNIAEPRLKQLVKNTV